MVLPLEIVEGDPQQELAADITTALARSSPAPNVPRRPSHRTSGAESARPNLVLARPLDSGSDPRK